VHNYILFWLYLWHQCTYSCFHNCLFFRKLLVYYLSWQSLLQIKVSLHTKVTVCSVFMPPHPILHWSIYSPCAIVRESDPLTLVPQSLSWCLPLTVGSSFASQAYWLDLDEICGRLSLQSWMAAYPGCTLQMKTLFPGWPIMIHDTHTRRRRRLPLTD